MISSFRDVGPKVFISYCFKDKEAASRVSAFLTEHGCQVRMEDEVSLIGRRLDLILPQRVGQAEAFVQLRTSSACLSPWVAKEMEYALAPRDCGIHLVLAPVAFEATDLAALSAASRPIDATCGLSDDVLEILRARVAEAVHVLPLSDENPFRFKQDALMDTLVSLPSDGRRVIVDNEGKLLQWMTDCLAHIEGSEWPHKNNYLKQERRRRERLVKLLADFDGEASNLITQLVEAYKSWCCPFPGRAAEAMNYFCLVRVGLAVIERASQLPVTHELRVKHANIFRSLVERLPADKEIYNAYFQWNTGTDYLLRMPNDEDHAALRALENIGIDDKTFTHFMRIAETKLKHLLEV
jgi:hypothetical protein